MQERVELKVRVLKSIADRLDRECQYCGCSKNQVIQSAILDKIHRLSAVRVAAQKNDQLPGQQSMEVE